MAGECRLKDRDNNQTVDKIEDGVWSGQLDGTFSGRGEGSNAKYFRSKPVHELAEIRGRIKTYGIRLDDPDAW